MNNEIAHTVRRTARAVAAATDSILGDALDGRPLDRDELEMYADTLRTYASRIEDLLKAEGPTRTRLVG